MTHTHGLTEDDTNLCDNCGLLTGSCCGVADDSGFVLCGPCHAAQTCEDCGQSHPGQPHNRD